MSTENMQQAVADAKAPRPMAVKDKKKSEAKKFAQRLRRIMQDSGYRISATALAHEFNLRDNGEGISVASASNWLNGISIPKMDKLITLAGLFQVQIQDLLFDKFLVQNISFTSLSANDVMHFDNVSPTELKALQIYRQLPKEHRKMVREVVLGLKSLNSGGDERQHEYSVGSLRQEQTGDFGKTNPQKVNTKKVA